MAGLVEQVADADRSRSFAHEVEGQGGRVSRENAGHRIQFLSAARQIGARDAKVSGSGSANGCEQ